MAQTIQAKNTSINFTNFDNLANKEGFISGNIQAYSNSTLIDGSTGKIKTSNVVKVNTTSQNLADKLTTPALFLNWSGAQLSFNGNTYTINTTPELLEALLAAGKVTDLGASNSKLRASSFYTKYNELLNRIDNLLISYTYVEPEEPEYVFSINDNYDTIAWDGTKTVTATLTNGNASNTQWTLTGDTQYATISSSTGSSTKVTAKNTAINSQGISRAEPTIDLDGSYLKCVPGQATITTYGAQKSVTLKATNNNATSGSPQSCIINIQAKPDYGVSIKWSSIDWYVISGDQYASLSGTGTTCKVTNHNYSGSTQLIKVRCVVYYGSSGSKSKDYMFTVPNIEEETSYTYVGE